MQQFQYSISFHVDRNYTLSKATSDTIYMLDSNAVSHQYRNNQLLAVQGILNENDLAELGFGFQLLLGRKLEALNTLEKILSQRNKTYEGTLSYEALNGLTLLEPIRQEPRFQQWLKEAKKVHEERVAKYGHLFDD